MTKPLQKSIFLVLLACVLFVFKAFAQTNLANYSLSFSTSSYTPITGGTVVVSGSYDNTISGAAALGGTFTFGGTAFTSCYVSSNGFITFGAAPTGTNYTPMSTLGSTTGAISAFGQDAGSSTVSGSAPEISYLNIGGTTGEFVVQYTDHANYYNRSVERLNFQIRLNLATNEIKIVYGSCTNPGNVSTTGTTPQVGIRGNSVTYATNVNNLMIGNNPSGTTCNWSNAVTGFANNSNLLFAGLTNVNVNIPTGLTLTWTPQTVVSPVRTFSAVTAVTSSDATINWTAPTGATQYNVQYRQANACTWTNFSGNPVSGATATLTGLTPYTQYQVRVQAGDGINSTIWSHIPDSAGTGNGYTSRTFTTANVACSGSPTAGTVTAPSAVCPSASFNLSSSGYSFTAGITYQWESSPAGIGAWAAISGATNPTYTVSTGITSATDYRFVVTCANGGSTDISAISSISVNPFYNCYCTPASNCTNEGIENVTFVALNNNSTFCNNTSGYTDYANLGSVATISQGQIVPISVTGHINSNPASAGVWIDYNHNGTFDATEYTSLGSSTGISPLPSTYIYSGNVIVDINAQTGLTRMRVRQANQGGITATSACTNSGIYGEYEDYLVTITSAPSCSGSPTAGTASGPASVCANTSFNLTVAGATNGVMGLSYQWESSPAGVGSWTAISGATTLNYTVSAGITTATDYHMIITCVNGGGTDVTNTVAVAMNPITQCYCIPTYVNGGGSDYVANVQLGTLSNNTGSLGNPAPYYHDYTTQQPGTLAIPDLAQGVSYNLTLTFGPDGTQYSRVWIDFNQDGTFTAAESFGNSTSVGGNGTTTIAIQVPANALLGNVRMRIRGGDDSQPTGAQACGASSSTYGEGEDYLVNITLPPTCLPPSSPNVTGITTSGATINWTASTSTPSSGYDYYYNTASTAPTGTTTPTGSVGAGVTTVTLGTLNGSTTYYYWVRSNCGNGDFSSWTGGTFQTLLSNDLPSGAIALTLNGGCITYTNVGGTMSPGEPPISCRGTTLTSGAAVWFSFVAPTSGFVKVSTDGSATALDTKLGVFSTSNPSNPADLTAYSIIACDDDNGITYGTASTVYVSGLTAGTTYYVAVDQYNGASTGSFCVRADEVTSAMLSPTGSCLSTGQTPFSREDYTGWATIVDDQGRLIANARRTAGTGSTTVYNYSASLTVNSAAVRANGTRFYLDRNFLLGYSQSAPATTFDVRLYFLDAELTALQAVDNTATLSNLNVTHQTGTTCVANFTSASGTNSLLTQMNNGTANGVSWITVNTPGFSNFYIMAGTSPLLINLKSIAATNFGNRNRVDWTTGSEMRGDYFELERSADGNNYTKIASVNAKGQPSSYTYWDESPLNGLNHYRLKMYAASGQFTYSEVVTANVKGQFGFSVEAYPNPASDVVNVKINGSLGGDASVSITDISGKVIQHVPVTGNLIQVNMRGFASGVYIIKYNDDTHSKTIKLTKE